MKENSNAVILNFLCNLQLVFIVLKFLNVITWNWWLVTAIMWLPLASFTVIATAVFIVGLVVAIINNNK